MPDAVKISELPARAAVGTDLVPAIDTNFGQTVRLTVSSVAAIGGGPPGDNTVTTAKIANGAVTYAKIQSVTQDRILGRATASNGVVEEIVCTPFARTVLAAPDSLTAVTALGALASTVDPTFTGSVKVPLGTAALPSYTFTGDTNTGFYSPGADQVGISTGGTARLTVAADGLVSARMFGTNSLYQGSFVRAQLFFNGVPASPTIYTGGNFGFASVTKTAEGRFSFTFSQAMPDTNFVAAVSCNISAVVIMVLNKTINGFAIQLREWEWQNGNPQWGYADTSEINVAVFR